MLDWRNVKRTSGVAAVCERLGPEEGAGGRTEWVSPVALFPRGSPTHVSQMREGRCRLLGVWGAVSLYCESIE